MEAGTRIGRAAATGLVAVTVCAGALTGCGGAPKTPTEVVQVPQQYKSYFRVASRRCPGVLTPPGMAAMAYVESRFNPDAQSGNGADGLMQILPSVFRQYGVDADGDGKRNIFSAADSVATSAVYTCVLARDVRSIKGDQVALRLAAYNAGIGAVHRYKGVPPYAETKDYIAQVKLWTARFAPQFASPSPSPSR